MPVDPDEDEREGDDREGDEPMTTTLPTRRHARPRGQRLADTAESQAHDRYHDRREDEVDRRGARAGRDVAEAGEEEHPRRK